MSAPDSAASPISDSAPTGVRRATNPARHRGRSQRASGNSTNGRLVSLRVPVVRREVAFHNVETASNRGWQRAAPLVRNGNRLPAIAADGGCSSRSRHTAERVLRRAESRCAGQATTQNHQELPSVPLEFRAWAPEPGVGSTDSSTTDRGTGPGCRGGNYSSSLCGNARPRSSHNRRNWPRRATARARKKPATPRLPPTCGAQNSARIAGS
jgi:hypothetical protein